MTRVFARRAAALAVALVLAACASTPAPRTVRGIHAVLALEPWAGQTIGSAQWNQAMDALFHKLRTLTVKQGIARVTGDRVAVELPGYTDIDAFRRLFPDAMVPSLRLVNEAASESDIADGHAPPGTAILPLDGPPGSATALAVYDAPLVTGAHITHAESTIDARTGAPMVTFHFDSDGTVLFAAATRTHIGQRFAIVIDGRIVSAPVIREPIWGGAGVIAGRFTAQQAAALAASLTPGTAPLLFRLVSAQVTDVAALGSD